jgi:hypothetical protein
MATTLIIASLLLCFPSSAIADGGPVLSDPELWAQLEEGQQTAVVTLKNDDTVDVDLFVSLLDNSGESHEVVFFVPLGTEAADFSVVEKTSLDFDEELIEQLDEALRREAERERNVLLSLLSPTLLTSGGWMLALCFPLFLSGCAGMQPDDSYETESSRVDIYGLDEDTDLEALINTTGLDPSVRETLARLTGQRIAVVTLQTQPPVPGDGDDGWWEPTGQPGIHLAWTTALVAQSDSVAYSYPLGTGSSWAHPIGLTRIYVVAPPGVDFTAEYPRLGADYSGYSGLARGPFYLFDQPRPRIIDHYDTPAYAVDEAWGDFGHIWRVTYTQSNSSKDVVISLAAPGGFLTTVRRSLRGWGMMATIPLGLLIALLLWVVAWRYLLGSMVGTAGFVAVAVVAGLLIAVGVFGVPSILIFVRRQRREMGVAGGRAAWAYIVVVLVANAAYLALALGYAAVVGAI